MKSTRPFVVIFAKISCESCLAWRREKFAHFIKTLSCRLLVGNSLRSNVIIYNGKNGEAKGDPSGSKSAEMSHAARKCQVSSTSEYLRQLEVRHNWPNFLVRSLQTSSRRYKCIVFPRIRDSRNVSMSKIFEYLSF